MNTTSRHQRLVWRVAVFAVLAAGLAAGGWGASLRAQLMQAQVSLAMQRAAQAGGARADLAWTRIALPAVFPVGLQ